ncbi:hypothetical protein ALC56_12395 [Trachymyrmex septentrionalis]|uniref:Uncharacterized protein n=1 Tax=Trachymyrmex septentrionalis TaxID=34720 RepID=A0A195EYP1_9HYME|nr:hypothetical protein ALC56_12395 [Trachymyrmex septentrionalis]
MGLEEHVSWILFAKRQSGSFDIPQVSFVWEYRKGLTVGLKDCVVAAPAVADWRKLVSICHGSLASRLRNGFGASSIYGSGVAVIRRWAKSGAKYDGVGPMPAKVKIDTWKEGRNENEGASNIAPKGTKIFASQTIPDGIFFIHVSQKYVYSESMRGILRVLKTGGGGGGGGGCTAMVVARRYAPTVSFVSWNRRFSVQLPDPWLSVEDSISLIIDSAYRNINVIICRDARDEMRHSTLGYSEISSIKKNRVSFLNETEFAASLHSSTASC